MSLLTCPNCSADLSVTVVATQQHRYCVTCGLLISEHFKRFGHASWCEVPIEEWTADRRARHAARIAAVLT